MVALVLQDSGLNLLARSLGSFQSYLCNNFIMLLLQVKSSFESLLLNSMSLVSEIRWLASEVNASRVLDFVSLISLVLKLTAVSCRLVSHAFGTSSMASKGLANSWNSVFFKNRSLFNASKSSFAAAFIWLVKLLHLFDPSHFLFKLDFELELSLFLNFESSLLNDLVLILAINFSSWAFSGSYVSSFRPAFAASVWDLLSACEDRLDLDMSFLLEVVLSLTRVRVYILRDSGSNQRLWRSGKATISDKLLATEMLSYNRFVDGCGWLIKSFISWIVSLLFLCRNLRRSHRADIYIHNWAIGLPCIILMLDLIDYFFLDDLNTFSFIQSILNESSLLFLLFPDLLTGLWRRNDRNWVSRAESRVSVLISTSVRRDDSFRVAHRFFRLFLFCLKLNHWQRLLAFQRLFNMLLDWSKNSVF